MTGLGLAASWAWGLVCLFGGGWVTFQLPFDTMRAPGIFFGWLVLLALFTILGLMAISYWDSLRIRKLVLRLLADGKERKDCDISVAVHALENRVAPILRQMEEEGLLMSRRVEAGERVCGRACVHCPCRIYALLPKPVLA